MIRKRLTRSERVAHAERVMQIFLVLFNLRSPRRDLSKRRKRGETTSEHEARTREREIVSSVRSSHDSVTSSASFFPHSPLSAVVDSKFEPFRVTGKTLGIEAE